MSFRMVWFHALVLLSRKRWKVVPLFALGITVLAVADLAKGYGKLGDANQWDVLLNVFNDPFKVVVLLPAFFFILVADVVTQDLEGWGYLHWNRGPSRALWWWSKVGTVGIAAFLYSSMMWLIAVLVSVFTVQWQLPWSRLVMLSQWSYPGGLGPQHLHVPPPVILFQAWVLITWGLFVWGTIIALLAFVLRHTGIAWMTGAASCLISYGIWIIATEKAPWAPTLHLLLKVHVEFESRVPAFFTIGWSFLAETLLLLAAGVVGHLLSVRRDL
ncbi:hypothetical protein JCM14720_22990 [Calditerricola yamamurae]